LTGWRGHSFIPNLPKGEYALVASALNEEGIEMELPRLTLRITG
jgi:hypothetical protein